MPLPQTSDELYIEFENKQIPLPEYFETGSTPIVTEQFVKVLENTGADNFQVFPVEIRFEDGVTLGYYLLNIIGRITCIDEKASDCSFVGPVIMRMFGLKLIEENIRGQHIFRAGEYQDVIFISDRVKTAIESCWAYWVRTSSGR